MFLRPSSRSAEKVRISRIHPFWNEGNKLLSSELGVRMWGCLESESIVCTVVLLKEMLHFVCSS